MKVYLRGYFGNLGQDDLEMYAIANLLRCLWHAGETIGLGISGDYESDYSSTFREVWWEFLRIEKGETIKTNTRPKFFGLSFGQLGYM